MIEGDNLIYQLTPSRNVCQIIIQSTIDRYFCLIGHTIQLIGKLLFDKLSQVGHIVRSYCLLGRYITDQSFDTSVGWYMLFEYSFDNVFIFLQGQGSVCSCTVELIQLGVWYHRRRVKFDLIGTEGEIGKGETKSINILLYRRSIQSRHQMNRYLEGVLSEYVHRLTTLLNGMTSLVDHQYIIKHTLDTHLNPCNS